MSTAPSLTLSDALASVPAVFRARLLSAHQGLKAAFSDGHFDACGLRAGRLCEVMLRFLQHELTGNYIPFGTKIPNFKLAAEALEQAPSAKAPEGIRIIIPRALLFLYTLRNKRGIGHEGGEVDANQIDAAAAVRVADWAMCELVRVYHTLSLEEAQALCDAMVSRELPLIWEVLGRKRVLDTSLSYADQTLLLLYSDANSAVATEDLVSWTEHPDARLFRRDVLAKLHRGRFIEWDQDAQMVVIGPKGNERVEAAMRARGPAEKQAPIARRRPRSGARRNR